MGSDFWFLGPMTFDPTDFFSSSQCVGPCVWGLDAAIPAQALLLSHGHMEPYFAC